MSIRATFGSAAVAARQPPGPLMRQSWWSGLIARIGSVGGAQRR